MILFLLSLLAGALTVLAPCVLPLLPVVIVGTAEDSRNKFAPLVIIGSLGLSIILFTLLLKVSTAFITVPSGVWSGISATILVLFGLITLFPKAWDVVATRLKLGRSSNKLLADGWFKKGLGAIFLLLGVLIFFGIDKRIETSIVNSNYFNITTAESGLLKKFNQ